MAEVLRGLDVIAHPASYFLWVPLAEGGRADRVVRELLKHRIAVSTAEPFATPAQVPHAIRIALGSVNTDMLRMALAAVRRVIEDCLYG